MLKLSPGGIRREISTRGTNSRLNLLNFPLQFSLYRWSIQLVICTIPYFSHHFIGRNSIELMQACRKYHQTKSNCYSTLWCTNDIKRMDYWTTKQAPVSAFLSPCQDCTAVPWFLHVQAPNSALSQSHVLVHLLSPWVKTDQTC